MTVPSIVEHLNVIDDILSGDRFAEILHPKDLLNLETAGETLRYNIVITSRKDNWERLSQHFKHPEDIRRIIYTTNTIEAVHRQFRKLTKTKNSFPNQNGHLELLTMGI